jgi:hypothetical protein
MCGATREPGRAPAAPPLPRERLGRAARFALGAVALGALAGCGTRTDPSPTDGAVAEGGSEDAGFDAGLAMPYGAPPAELADHVV